MNITFLSATVIHIPPQKPSVEDAAALLRTIISKKGETLEYIEKKEAFERLCNGSISGLQEWYSVDDGSGSEPVTK